MGYVQEITKKMTEDDLRYCAISARLMAETADVLGFSEERRAEFTVLGYVYRAITTNAEIRAMLSDYEYLAEIDAIHKCNGITPIDVDTRADYNVVYMLCLIETHVDEFGTLMNVDERIADTIARYGEGSREFSRLNKLINVSISERYTAAFSKVLCNRLKNK